MDGVVISLSCFDRSVSQTFHQDLRKVWQLVKKGHTMWPLRSSPTCAFGMKLAFGSVVFELKADMFYVRPVKVTETGRFNSSTIKKCNGDTISQNM